MMEKVLEKAKEKGKCITYIKGEKVRVTYQHNKYYVSPLTSNCSTELYLYLKNI